MSARAVSESVQVELHAPELAQPSRVGVLHHRRGRGQSALSFAYDADWLRGDHAFALDPRLALYGGEQFPAAGHLTFGIFLDSAPDRWGRVLLDRREALIAHDESRKPRVLTDWDYLLGVQDECRMGALRFRMDEEAPYLAHGALAVPPVADLPELEAISLQLEQDHPEESPAYRQWLAMLIAPGTSLGGARPKANYREDDGGLWIAKFPSRDDRRDVGAWERFLYELATACGIRTAPSALRRFGAKHHTFCVKRFDREGDARRCFVSAMTLLERRDGEGGSYLELAEFIQTQGAQGAIAEDLEQLFRRVLFNVLVGNTDDHLRNHGFLRTPGGWRLAPAYDLNPNPARRHHALRLDDASDLPDVDTVLATAAHYRLKPQAATRLWKEMLGVIGTWRQAARKAGLHAPEIAGVAAAFELAEC
jgi:serine/threonine-protein kinase HipA